MKRRKAKKEIEDRIKELDGSKREFKTEMKEVRDKRGRKAKPTLKNQYKYFIGEEL